MRNNFKWLVFSGVVLFYAFLYIATSTDKYGASPVPPYCDEICDKVKRVDTLMRNHYAQSSTYNCNTDIVCIQILDSASQDWKGLADTACMYLTNEGLHNYNVAVIRKYNQDTLLKQKCP